MRLSVLLIALALAPLCRAHVGSPDVFHEGSAGPYRLLVTIRPPQVVPGVAFGLVSISGVYAREAQLEPGVEPDFQQKCRGRRAMMIAGALVVGMIYLGKLWWDSDETTFQRFLYKPLYMTAAVEPGGRLA